MVCRSSRGYLGGLIYPIWALFAQLMVSDLFRNIKSFHFLEKGCFSLTIPPGNDFAIPARAMVGEPYAYFHEK